MSVEEIEKQAMITASRGDDMTARTLNAISFSIRSHAKEKTCLNCSNPNCFVVSIPKEKRKDCKEHHENYDWNIVFDCKNHNKWKGEQEK